MAKIKDILANIDNVKVGTWVRGILLIISLVNMALSAAGKAPIPADYNELYTIVSVVFSVLVGISAYWKNNSFTEAAQTADKYLHEQGSAIEDHARCIERSYKMLKLLDTSVELLRTKHKYGESYYWLLYYTYLSPQQLANTQEIIDKLEPHIRDISYRTYFRKRQMAIDALSSVLWGYSSKESLALLEKFVPEANT